MKWWRKANLPHACRVVIVDAAGHKYTVRPGDTVTVQVDLDLSSSSPTMSARLTGKTTQKLRVEGDK